MAALPARSFAERLEYLIANMHPAGRGPYTDAEVSAGIAAQGGHLSRTALGKLRKGIQRNPTLATMRALAAYFGVPTSYFTEEDATGIQAQLAVAVFRRDTEVRAMALRMGRLSAESVRTLSTLSKQLVAIEARYAPEGAVPPSAQ